MDKSKRKIWLGLVPVLLLLILAPIMLVGCGESKNVVSATLTLTTDFNTKEYYLGEQIDVGGAVITYRAVYDDESISEEVVPVEKSFITGFDTEKPGAKTMTIIYKGKTVQVEYDVVNLRLGSYKHTQLIDNESKEPEPVEESDTRLVLNKNGRCDYGTPDAMMHYTYQILNNNGTLKFNLNDIVSDGYYDNECLYIDMMGDGSVTMVFEYVG